MTDETCTGCGLIENRTYGAKPLEGNQCQCVYDECGGCGGMVNLNDPTDFCDCDVADLTPEEIQVLIDKRDARAACMAQRVEVSVVGFVRDEHDPEHRWDWHGTVELNAETRLPVRVEGEPAMLVTADDGYGYVVVTVGDRTMDFRRPDLGLGGWI